MKISALVAALQAMLEATGDVNVWIRRPEDNDTVHLAGVEHDPFYGIVYLDAQPSRTWHCRCGPCRRQCQEDR